MLWWIIPLAVSSLPSAAFGAPCLKPSRYSRSCRRRDFLLVDNFYDRKKTASGEQPYAIAVARRMPHGFGRAQRLADGAVLETLGLDDAYFPFARPSVSWRALSSAALISARRRGSCGLPGSRSTLPKASRQPALNPAILAVPLQRLWSPRSARSIAGGSS